LQLVLLLRLLLLRIELIACARVLLRARRLHGQSGRRVACGALLLVRPRRAPGGRGRHVGRGCDVRPDARQM
jgi:hypothetical protein